MNCAQGGDILPKEGDDETDDGRYLDFGAYIKVYMCDICNGFLDKYVQYELFVLLVFHRNEQTSVLHHMKCKVCSNLAKQVADQLGRSIPPCTLSSDIGWPRGGHHFGILGGRSNWEISLPVELN